MKHITRPLFTRYLWASLALLLWAGSFLGPTSSAYAIQPTVTILIAPQPTRNIHRGPDKLSDFLNSIYYNALADEGYAVYDATEMGDSFMLTSTNRNNILRNARALHRPPMDLVLLHKSRIKIRRTPRGPEAKIELSAELIEVSTGRRLETFRHRNPRNIRMPRHCDRRCMRDHIEPDMEMEAQAVTHRLLDTLADHIPQPQIEAHVRNDQPGVCGMRRGWELTFSNFSPALMQNLEEYLVAFSCYVAHRPTAANPGEYVFWYESAIAPAHFQRNIQRMATDMGIEIALNAQGNRYRVAYQRDMLFDTGYETSHSTNQSESFDGW